ncbi:MAG: hypothetical protein QXJ75_04920, partial [Candidatus Bathyarchaeia archaeon]
EAHIQRGGSLPAQIFHYLTPPPYRSKHTVGGTPMLVCFSGVDGSGKTSHAKACVRKLELLGYPCRYAWCRWVRLVTYPLTICVSLFFMLRSRRFSIRRLKSDFYENKKKYLRNKFLAAVWGYVTLLDYKIIYLYKIKLPAALGKTVICDRYIYDWIADMQLDGLYKENVARIVLKIFQKPDLTFVLDVAEELSISRRKYDTLTLMEARKSREIYLNLSKRYSLTLIPNDGTFTETHERIMKTILKAIC